MPPDSSYLVGRYDEIKNEIDNLDNLKVRRTGIRAGGPRPVGLEIPPGPSLTQPNKVMVLWCDRGSVRDRVRPRTHDKRSANAFGHFLTAFATTYGPYRQTKSPRLLPVCRNPLSLGVWPFTLRFILPRSWVGYPRRRPKGCGMCTVALWTQSLPKVYS